MGRHDEAVRRLVPAVREPEAPPDDPPDDPPEEPPKGRIVFKPGKG